MVAAIRTMYARAGRRIAIIGHRQGGMVGRWALRWWPDTRVMIDDLIGIAPSNNGSALPHATCNAGCSPADSQKASGSNFLTALNTTQETFPGISYSVILSRFDEEAVPAGTLSGGGGQITNTYVQDVCPNDHTEHLGLGTYDPVAIVSFAGRRVLTDAAGRAALPVRVARPGRYRLIAARAGCARAVARLRVTRKTTSP